MLETKNKNEFTNLLELNSNSKSKRSVETSTGDEENQLRALATPLLVERVSGTPNIKIVQDYLIRFFESQLNWQVDLDDFHHFTPNGYKQFTNIIVTPPNHEPKGRRLIMAAHYESKFMEEEKFIGAVDSAIPVAILMHLAKEITPLFERYGRKNINFQIVLFDGEEAFKDWTATDSLYGSRHLAEKWRNEVATDKCSKTDHTQIDCIETLILLDLIGSKTNMFHSFFSQTNLLYQRFVTIEGLMGKYDLFKHPLSERHNYFDPALRHSFIDDDHRPFLQLGVPVIHLISTPFPPQWHKGSRSSTPDDATQLHWPSIVDINRIFRIFVIEYFHLFN
ncbi:hypothetical protein SNEBB_009450 [Seison nebaliae]|nr:hypothetical protein SNEBB_009450 [Seison nebaliae]